MSHDCVIVPGIGALLAHGLEACYNENEAQWFPPARVISFNPELSRTDGLIASSVARRDGISMKAATTVVRKECDAMRRRLETERRLSLGAAGMISLTSDGRMTFTPGDAAWLSPETMWLPALSLANVSKEETAFGRRIAAEAERRRRNTLIRRVASAAACLAVIFLIGWIVAGNIKTSPLVQFASFAPVETEEADGVFFGEISDAPADVILAQEPEQAVEEDMNATPDVKYVLIVASLSSEADAKTFISHYPELKLGIINNEGRYRIYAAGGNSWDTVAAAAYSPEISSRFDSTWVCVL